MGHTVLSNVGEKWFGVLVRVFFWIQKLLEHLKWPKKIYQPKSFPGYEVDFSGNANCLQQRKWLERNNPVPGYPQQLCGHVMGLVKHFWSRLPLESHNYWLHLTAVRVGSEHPHNSTTRSPCWRNQTHPQHGILCSEALKASDVTRTEGRRWGQGFMKLQNTFLNHTQSHCRDPAC